ncbi:MAG: hypothetical protein P1U86_18935 [Verrucomicrobiales bacterium]|nr:hypothetical protein [Verrucomicrobiales bacterium]
MNSRTISISLALVFAMGLFTFSSGTAEENLRVGVFEVDASPPVGSALAYDPTKGIQTPLSCRGIVIAGSGEPIVMVAVDWIGISNSGQTVFKEAIAGAVGTDLNRVVVHTLHQHDAPRCDFDAEVLIAEHGISGAGFDPDFARGVAENAATAARVALADAQEVTHLGTGTGIVEKVASNRRILGPDGKVLHTRYTATKNETVRAFPAGTIDPELKMITFWSGEKAIVALTYYATHPQSYYRTGLANPDFPGLARNAREAATGIPHIHFNGAGGNIGAGKWNDGARENRQVLANRVAAGMEKALAATAKTPIRAEDVEWGIEPVLLPVGKHLVASELEAKIKNKVETPGARFGAAKALVWLQRCEAGDTIPITCLTLKDARILHMPGELFVEYQLAGQKLREDLFVAMAAYGDYAPGYIGTEIAYGQGGYETSERASRVEPGVEKVLTEAVAKLLDR